MYEAVVIATFGDEILDIIVTTEGPMMAMVDLDEGCRAARPGAGAMAGVNGPTLLWCDRDGATPEVERIAVAVLEDGEEPGIAGQPPGGIASDGNAGRLQHVGCRPGAVGVGDGGGVDERVDRDMHDELGGESARLQGWGCGHGRGFAQAQKSLGTPLAAIERRRGSTIESSGVRPLGAHRSGGRFETGQHEFAVYVIEPGAQLDAVLVADDDHPSDRCWLGGGGFGELGGLDAAPCGADALYLTDGCMDGKVDKCRFGLGCGDPDDRLGLRNREATLGDGLGEDGEFVQGPAECGDAARPSSTELTVPGGEELDRATFPLRVQSADLDFGQNRCQFGLGGRERAGQLARSIDQLIVGEFGGALCKPASGGVIREV